MTTSTFPLHKNGANLEEPLRIGDIAASAQLSVRALERRFNLHFKSTPKAYYREFRLAHANNLLLNTSLSICEFGLACGYSNGFTMAYKKVFSITPADYRRQEATLQCA